MTTALDTRAARDRRDWFYRLVRATARFWLWFFFKSVDVRHPERVPDAGPVLLCINHPNNFIDSLLVGAAVGRKVHYLATAGLFRRRLVARFLRACGAISVYRRQDDPRTCRRPPTVGAGLADPATTEKNADTFAACAAALAEGHVIAIYPEGTTHAEARVQRIKTGAARIALAYEAERPGGSTRSASRVPSWTRWATSGRAIRSESSGSGSGSRATAPCSRSTTSRTKRCGRGSSPSGARGGSGWAGKPSSAFPSSRTAPR